MSNCPSSQPNDTCSHSFMSLLNPPGMHHNHNPPPASQISSAEDHFKSLGHFGDAMGDTSQCHSSGSSAISSANPQSCVENSRGSSLLQEHDYMGLAEISSSSVLPKQDNFPSDNSENIEETDLRLGLAPPALVPTKHFSGLRNEDHGLYMDGRSDVAVKYGLKRGYSEAMYAVGSCSGGGTRLGVFDKGIDFSSVVTRTAFQTSATNGSLSTQTPNLQASPLHCGWSSVKPTNLGLRPGASSGTYSSSQMHPTSLMGGQELEKTRRAPLVTSDENQATQDSNPPKSQVVGWPPVRSFRKSTLAAHPKSALETEGVENSADNSARIPAPQTSLYVKVNLDGVPVGRKVFLGSYNSYEDLSNALKEMFQLPKTGQGGARFVPSPCDQSKPFHFHNDFSLTYEDKDGDWMLVGDVPWRMFVNTLCRLRIMKSSEGTCTGPRAL